MTHVNIPISECTKYRHKLQVSMVAWKIDMPITSLKRYMLYKKHVNIPISECTKYKHKLQVSMMASKIDMPFS